MFSIPFAPFDVSEVYRRMKARNARSQQARASRQSLRDALALDDNILRDIGVTRDEVNHALRR